MLTKRLTGLILLILVGLLVHPILNRQAEVQAQTLEILAGNTLYGAATGAALATGTMAMKSDFDDLRPLRFGVGLGTLTGLGIGAYDLSQRPSGDQLYVTGSFNEVNATGLILLLDTFYGAGTGVLVGSAITLMTGDPIIEGVRYGAGIGAWGGFAFGVADAFFLSRSNSVMATNDTRTSNSVDGLLSFDSGKNWQVGLINPSVKSFRSFDKGQIGISFATSLDVLNVKIDL